MWRKRGAGATFPCLSSYAVATFLAPASTTTPRVQRKKMKIKTSENPFISFHLFFRIETFQIITSEKAKKSGSLSTRVRGCERERFERLCDDNSFPPGARPLGSTHTAAKKVRNINF